jgi:hypothetical protein
VKLAPFLGFGLLNCQLLDRFPYVVLVRLSVLAFLLFRLAFGSWFSALEESFRAAFSSTCDLTMSYNGQGLGNSDLSMRFIDSALCC